ncbi:hypothetical protein [Pseudolysinimonas sp.]|uniref:hypothetical protein n=1 Tax=Pseudolysinimonas sp. TaxID=2680009 RepID=UPI003F7D3585
MDGRPAIAEAQEAVDAAVAELTASGARAEVLAEWRTGRRIGPLRRPDAVAAVGRVWRLGALLLAPDGTLRRTGEVIQAQPLRFDNHQSNRAAVRRELRVAIEKAGIPAGETVNIDAPPVALADVLEVSWNGSGEPGTLVPLPVYLRERVELLAHPPGGA